MENLPIESKIFLKDKNGNWNLVKECKTEMELNDTLYDLEYVQKIPRTNISGLTTFGVPHFNPESS